MTSLSLRKQHFRARYPIQRLFQLGSLMIVLVLAMIITIFLARSSENYGCLRYDTAQPRHYVPLYDFQFRLQGTGTQTAIPVQNAQAYSHPTERRLFSPDGQYLARLITYSQISPDYSLDMIDPAQNKPYADAKFTIEDGGVKEFAWTPDNMEVYIGWGGSYYLAKANPRTGEKHVVLLQRERYSTPPSLSPDGAYLAQIDTSQSYQLGSSNALPPLNVSVVPTSMLFGDGAGHEPVLHFSLPQVNRPDETWIRWSPDSRHFAILRHFDIRLHGVQPTYVTVDVLGVDGTLITDLIAVWLEQTAQGNMIIPARWSADGHSILVAAEMSGPMQVPNAKLLAYRTDTQRVDVIAKQLADRPLFSFENMPFYAYDDPQHEQIVLVEYQSNLQQTVEMLNTNGENRHTLIHDADSVGQPLWLPDGVTVAIPWARGKGQARHSYLLLGNDQDATKLQALDYGYQDIEGVHWLEKYNGYSNQLIFVGHSSKGDDANLLSLQTGERQVLAQGLKSIYDLHQDSGTGAINFWWQKPDGSAGTDGYSLDGRQIYRFSASQVEAGGGEVYQSPDGRTALIAVNKASGITYELSWAGRTEAHIIRTGATMPDDVAWTPDGKLVAFAYKNMQQSSNNDQRTVDVFAADGSDWHFMSMPQVWAGPGLAFSQCNEVVASRSYGFSIGRVYRP